MERVQHPFQPIVDEECHILILGSFPSVKSREDGFYYAHPQNRFWRMLAAVYEEETPTDIPAKQKFLLRHHIALWDVIASCEIEGSADASVKEAVPVEIEQIIKVAKIAKVLCNGKLAAKLYHQYLEPCVCIKAISLPSSSPANAAFSIEKLVETWRAALLQ